MTKRLSKLVIFQWETFLLIKKNQFSLRTSNIFGFIWTGARMFDAFINASENSDIFVDPKFRRCCSRESNAKLRSSVLFGLLAKCLNIQVLLKNFCIFLEHSLRCTQPSNKTRTIMRHTSRKGWLYYFKGSLYESWPLNIHRTTISTNTNWKVFCWCL